MRFIALLLLFPTLAAAQVGHPLLPLQEGGVREYERGYTPQFAPYRILGYERHTVGDETTVAGVAYQTITVEDFGSDYTPEGSRQCGLRVSDTTGQIEWTALGPESCDFPGLDDGPDLRTLTPENLDVYVGRQSVTLGVATYAHPDTGALLELADGVGPLSWEQRVPFEGAHTTRLVYAQVEGDAIGQRFDSDDWMAFYHLNEGDVREYRYRRGHRFGGEAKNEVWRVGPDTTIGGLRHQIVRMQTRSTSWFDGDTTYTRTAGACTLHFALTEGTAKWTHLYGDTTCPGGSVDLRITGYVMTQEPVLGEDRTVLQAEYSELDAGWSRHYAEGVGPVYENYYDTSGPGGGSGSGTRSLIYAQINGVEYGTPAYATGTSPRPDSLYVGAAFPNPTYGSVTLPLTLPMGRGEVVVFDVLGRQVRRFTASASADGVTFDIADLPAGTYAVVTTAGGETAVQMLTKVD